MKNFMQYNFTIERICYICFVPPGKGSVVHRNRANHGLALHIGGDKIYRFEGGPSLPVRTNDIIFMPKDSNYDVSSSEPGACYAINFDITGPVSFAPFVFSPKNVNTILDHFKTAEKIWKKKNISFELKCKAELYNILYALQKDFFLSYVPTEKIKLIEPAVEYIHKNYTKEPLQVASLAEMCNITPEYFRAVFKSIYGTSPILYINNLKITYAKELLSSNLYPVTEVAFASGFNDTSHFSREFKKVTGYAPSQFKKQGII